MWLDLVGGVLHGEHVVVAGVGIDPVAGRDDAVGGERGDDVVDDIFGREADERGALAIDVELQAGILEVLRDVDIADAREAAQLLRDVLRLGEGGGLIVGADLNIERRGQALIHDGVDETAGLEVGLDLRHVGCEPAAHAIDVGVAAGGVVFVEPDLDEGGVHRRVAGVDGGEIGRDADVGDDHAEIVRRDDLADFVLDARDVGIAGLDARAAGHFDIDDELAGIGAREVGAAEDRSQHDEDERGAAEQNGSGEAGTLHGAVGEHLVAIEHALEVDVEAVDDAVKDAAPVLALFRFRRALRAG